MKIKPRKSDLCAFGGWRYAFVCFVCMHYDLTHFYYCKCNFYLSLKLQLLVSSSSNNKNQAEYFFFLNFTALLRISRHLYSLLHCLLEHVLSPVSDFKLFEGKDPFSWPQKEAIWLHG